MTPDFQQTVEMTASGLALGILGFIMRWLQTHFRMAADDRVRQYLESALEHAVHFGVLRVKDWAGSRDFSDKYVRNELVKQAVAYVQTTTPSAVARFGINDQLLGAMVEARLAKMTGLIDPSVPDAPGPLLPSRPDAPLTAPPRAPATPPGMIPAIDAPKPPA